MPAEFGYYDNRIEPKTCPLTGEKVWPGYTRDVKALVEEKKGLYLGEYACLGFDTFGPFKLVGGLQKGHPTEEEIQSAVDYYNNL